MAKRVRVLIFIGGIAMLLAQALVPNRSWNLFIYAQTYTTGNPSSSTIPGQEAGIVLGQDVGAPVFIVSTTGPSLSVDAYQQFNPLIVSLLSAAGLDEITPITTLPNPIGPAIMQTISLNNGIEVVIYFNYIIEGHYVYHINVYQDGVLVDDSMMYMVNPDESVVFFYQPN